jgi:L-seryl-tRNA(Ser) seleniumtransferase
MILSNTSIRNYLYISIFLKILNKFVILPSQFYLFMKVLNKQEYLSKIPSVDEILNRVETKNLFQKFPRCMIVKAIQLLLAEKRRAFLSIQDGARSLLEFDSDVMPLQVEAKLEEMQLPSLRRVINATGIVVHTNLGRAPLAEEAIKRVTEVARHYSNLEFDIASGTRGSRYAHVIDILAKLTQTKAAFVVNNNAAAVFLCLNTLAKDREVIISRGELIEIGGSFRIPEVMAQSGAKLVEVGTTNRTYLRDYRNAINENTALLLKVHPSNYKVVGFTSEVGLPDLRKLGNEFQLPVMLDMGSGNLVEPLSLGLQDEPLVQHAVKEGADLITFSGDKLLGGPQAGIIIGKRNYITSIAKNPLTRALRVDKLTLAALEATLKIYYLEPEHVSKIPVLGMLSTSEVTLRKRARSIAKKLKKYCFAIEVNIMKEVSKVGGGAYPLQELPTWVVSLKPQTMTAPALEERLRKCTPPIIARISKDQVLLDMRTLFPEEISMVTDSITAIYQSQA